MRIALRSYDLMLGRVRITFQRTLRIPDDGREYPLPPEPAEMGLGAGGRMRQKIHVDRHDRGPPSLASASR